MRREEGAGCAAEEGFGGFAFEAVRRAERLRERRRGGGGGGTAALLLDPVAVDAGRRGRSGSSANGSGADEAAGSYGYCTYNSLSYNVESSETH